MGKTAKLAKKKTTVMGLVACICLLLCVVACGCEPSGERATLPTAQQWAVFGLDSQDIRFPLSAFIQQSTVVDSENKKSLTIVATNTTQDNFSALCRQFHFLAGESLNPFVVYKNDTEFFVGGYQAEGETFGVELAFYHVDQKDADGKVLVKKGTTTLSIANQNEEGASRFELPSLFSRKTLPADHELSAIQKEQSDFFATLDGLTLLGTDMRGQVVKNGCRFTVALTGSFDSATAYMQTLYDAFANRTPDGYQTEALSALVRTSGSKTTFSASYVDDLGYGYEVTVEHYATQTLLHGRLNVPAGTVIVTATEAKAGYTAREETVKSNP